MSDSWNSTSDFVLTGRVSNVNICWFYSKRVSLSPIGTPQEGDVIPYSPPQITRNGTYTTTRSSQNGSIQKALKHCKIPSLACTLYSNSNERHCDFSASPETLKSGVLNRISTRKWWRKDRCNQQPPPYRNRSQPMGRRSLQPLRCALLCPNNKLLARP